VIDGRPLSSLDRGPANRQGLVAVVIVGYNTKDLLVACLASLRTIVYRPLQIIYVDNGSLDGSLDAVRHGFPEVLALDSGGNLGYCGGNNVGIRAALESGAEYILILNPDTTVYDPAFVGKLVDYLRDHPQVGKVGPRVFLRGSEEVQNTVLSWPSVRLSVRSRLQRSESTAGPEAARQVDVLNGCCVLVRAAAFEGVGLYDEEYFAYVDEAEWDWRAEAAGWKRHFVPIDSIVHHQKQTGYEFTSRAHFLMKRNTAIWFLNAGKPLSLLAWMAATMSMALTRTIAAPFHGQSFGRYFQFSSQLAVAYGEILGRLFRGQQRTPEALRVAGR